jgi:hypothetical protein
MEGLGGGPLGPYPAYIYYYKHLPTDLYPAAPALIQDQVANIGHV